MPANGDIEHYRERAAHWNQVADALPPGSLQDAYRATATGYEELAALLTRLAQSGSSEDR